MTLYTTGARCTELTHLKVSDIGSNAWWCTSGAAKVSTRSPSPMASSLFVGAIQLTTMTKSSRPYRLTSSCSFLLPQGFVRIRHFAFLANRQRATTLPLCFQLLGVPQKPPTDPCISSSEDPNVSQDRERAAILVARLHP
jgi:hypothetical protein